MIAYNVFIEKFVVSQRPVWISQRLWITLVRDCLLKSHLGPWSVFTSYKLWFHKHENRDSFIKNFGWCSPTLVLTKGWRWFFRMQMPTILVNNYYKIGQGFVGGGNLHPKHQCICASEKLNIDGLDRLSQLFFKDRGQDIESELAKLIGRT